MEEKTAAKRRDHKALSNPNWNFSQALYLILVVYLVEFFLGWLKLPDSLGSLKGFINYLMTGFGEGFLFLIALLIFLRIMHRSFSDLGLVHFGFKNLIFGVSGGIFLFIFVGVLGNLIVEYLGNPDPQSFALAVSGASSIWQFVLLLILGGVIVPLKEELIFRGLVYPPLRAVYGKGSGILITALFFGAMHFDLIRFFPLFLGGVVLTWLYEKTQSLWPSVIAHGIWNILMTILMWWQKG
ncbi:MAG: CPBP family intramembrane metalloprotease [Peptococcaceae bacterium]|nr:CPBP family intramembrane metalloprotease [Peptococcaceae bacterium]